MKKLILLSLIPASVAMPLVSLASCGQQEPIEPPGCVDIMGIYQPDMPIPIPDPGTEFTFDEAQAKYLELNKQTNNRLFIEDAIYSASLCFDARFIQPTSEYTPHNDISECKVRYRVTDDSFDDPNNSKFGVDLVMKGKYCKFINNQYGDDFHELEDFSFVLSWDVDKFEMNFPWGPQSLWINTGNGFSFWEKEESYDVSHVKLTGYGIEDGVKKEFNRVSTVKDFGHDELEGYVPFGFIGGNFGNMFSIFSYYFKDCIITDNP